MPAATKKRDSRLPFAQIDEDFLAPRDPVLGYIKIGGKGSRVLYAGGTGRPWVPPTRFVDPARFEVTTREKRTQQVEGQGKAKGQKFDLDMGYKRDDAFHTAIDDAAPSSLKIRLMYPHWQQSLIAFLGAYGKSAWVCRGDGVEAIDSSRGECVCPCPRLAQFEGTYEGPPPNDGRRWKDGDKWRTDGLFACKPHAQLNVILEDAEIFGGFWAFKTTSYETISNLIKSLQTLEAMFDRLDGLPLEMRVMAASKSFGGGLTTQPIVTIIVPASMNTARQVAADAAAESRKFLPVDRSLDEETYREAVVAEMVEEEGSYAGEFAPDSQVDPQDLEEARAAEVEEPDDEGPDFEVIGPDEKLELEQAAPPQEGPEGADEPEAGAGDSVDRAAAEAPLPSAVPASEAERYPPDDSDRNEVANLCRAVLIKEGWESDAIQGRIEHHEKAGDLESLRARLERHCPESYQKVTAPDMFAEPKDGLPE